MPARAGDRGFLPLFNATLALAGLISVLAIVVISASIAGRLTRPLHDVATAARRLGAGESGARATGGDDLESAQLAEAFNAMADRLERSEMLRRRAASDIAHDLATPATVLESQLQAMIDGVVPTDPAGLEVARSAAAALAGVVADIDDLARAEAAPLQSRPERVDLSVAIPRGRRWRSTARAGRATRRSRWTSHRGSPRGPIPVTWAVRCATSWPTRSAIAPTEGSSRWPRSGPDRSIRIRVGDTGPGIAPGDIDHVFERFYRADVARATDPATGRPTGSGWASRSPASC